MIYYILNSQKRRHFVGKNSHATYERFIILNFQLLCLASLRASVFSGFFGRSPQTVDGAFPLDPAGDFSIDPSIAVSWLRPRTVFYFGISPCGPTRAYHCMNCGWERIELSAIRTPLSAA